MDHALIDLNIIMNLPKILHECVIQTNTTDMLEINASGGLFSL
jgi:hypothetical protein